MIENPIFELIVALFFEVLLGGCVSSSYRLNIHKPREAMLFGFLNWVFLVNAYHIGNIVATNLLPSRIFLPWSFFASSAIVLACLFTGYFVERRFFPD